MKEKLTALSILYMLNLIHFFSYSLYLILYSIYYIFLSLQYPILYILVPFSLTATIKPSKRALLMALCLFLIYAESHTSHILSFYSMFYSSYSIFYSLQYPILYILSPVPPATIRHVIRKLTQLMATTSPRSMELRPKTRISARPDSLAKTWLAILP